MCKRRKRFIYFIGLLLIIVSLIPSKNDVHAYGSLPQEDVDDQTCSQVQIVLLIDQSLSMRDNDPNDLRSYAPLHLVDVLARNYLMAQANQDPKVQPKRIDFAVIHFASMAEVLLDWTRIAPSDDAAWETRRSELKEVFEAYPNYDAIGNGTNFVRGFEVAEDMFQNDDAPVDGCPQRLVMVLTDGRPQIGENAWTNSQVEDHFLTISDITNSTFNIEGTGVYVTAIQNAGDTFYWRDTKDFWKTIVKDDPDFEIPRAEMVTSRSEIGGRMADIIKTTIGEGVVVLEPGPIVIPPYVDRMILDFYKTDSEDLMILEDSVGELTEARTDVEVHVYGQDSAIQTLEIIRPEPGVYQLSTTADQQDYRITQVTIFVNARLTQPADNLQQFTIGQIEIILVDSEGNTLPNYGKNYGLDIQPVLTYQGTEVPIAMAFIPEESKLVGDFKPQNSGTYTLTISADVVDDGNQTVPVINAEKTQFSMIVDPVSVEVGDIYSTKENCSPTINIPAQIPLSIVNTATDQTALINQAVDWTIEADPTLTTSVNKFGADGNYVLDILPSEAGTYDIHIVGTVADPVDGTPIQFFENTTRIVITDSTQYLMDGVSLEPQMKDFALGFDDFLNRISGHSEDRDVVIGRRFFFFPQEIRLEATFVDLDTDRIGDPTLLPDIQLKNQETGEVFENSEWVTDASGNVITNFSVSDFGNYQLIIDEKDTACDVVITLSDYVGTWRISPGLSERVLFILGILLAVALLIFLARLALCRWYNPLYGLVGIVDQEGKWHFWSPIDGRSCFTFKPTPPNKFGMVTKIKINGIFMPKGEFRISVFVITDPIKNKITKKRTNARLKNWRPIMLGNGFHIDWKRTIQEIKR